MLFTIADENEVLNLTDSEYTVNAISVSSQLGVDALFEFPHNEIGKSLTPCDEKKMMYR